MEELIGDSPELLSLKGRLSSLATLSPGPSDDVVTIDSLIDAHLEDISTISLPESVRSVLHIGERSFELPSDRVEFDKQIQLESERLAHVELAELASDPEVLSAVGNIRDPSEPVHFTEEEGKKLRFIEEEIQFALRAEAARKNPSLLSSTEPITEEIDEECVHYNTTIVDAFCKEVNDAATRVPSEGDLDLRMTYSVPFTPDNDPTVFIHRLACRNLYTVNQRPVLNSEAEVIDVEEIWERALDAKTVAKSMKYDRYGDSSGANSNMRGNGLEVPLDIAKSHGPDGAGPAEIESALGEAKFVDFNVLLKFSEEKTGRWPQVVEGPPPAAVPKASRIPAVIPNVNDDAFDLMGFVAGGATNPSVNMLSNAVDSVDLSAFVKKSKKRKKTAEEVNAIIPPEVVAAVTTTQKPVEDPTTGAAPPKMKATKQEAEFEYAKVLDVRSEVAEYSRMKHNLARTYPFQLDPFQQQAIVAMENGNSVFVAAHTSAGKTVVAEYAIALSRKHRSRVVYTSPIKALSNQKFRDFKIQFEDVGLITGDIQLNTDAACLVMTTEILKSMLYNGRVPPDELEWVIFDEVHYINNAERGHVWEEVLIMLPTQVNIVMLSATVPNCLEFADWVGRIKNRKIYVVQTLFRPVPLAHHIYTGKDKKTKEQLFQIVGRDGEFNQFAVKKANEAVTDQKSKKFGPPRGAPVGRPAFIPKGLDRSYYTTLINYLNEKNLLPGVTFVFSRNRCNQYAEMLYNLDLTTKEEKSAVRRLFDRYLDSFKGSDRNLPQVIQMQQLCYRGFAIHHSGILPILKELVEILFQKGYVKFLFATETFAMGVNMPARTVVFDSIEKFDGNSKRQLNCTEYIQMAGRAGRRGIDDTGMVIILAKGQPYEITALSGTLKGKPVSLVSQFRITYNMLLNILRAEQLNIEDMLQRSYVEHVSLRNLSNKKEQILAIDIQLRDLPKLVCPDCLPTADDYLTSVDGYHDALLECIQRGMHLWPVLLPTAASSLIVPGRYVVIAYPPRNVTGLLAVVVRARSRPGSDEALSLDVVTLELPPTSGVIDLEAMPTDEKSTHIESVLFDGISKYGFDYVLDHGQSPDRLEIIHGISPAWIQAVTKRKTKNVVERDIEAFVGNDPRSKGRSKSPSRSVRSLMTEIDSAIRLAVNNSPEMQYCKLGEDISPKEITLHDEVTDYVRLRTRLEDPTAYRCRSCVDFESHLSQIRTRKILEDKKTKLKHDTSFQALVLSQDYANCLEVLRELNFIDKDNIVALKGRVAAQINDDALLITELIFENKLQQRNCAEIAAMLCTLTAQHNSSKEKMNERSCIVRPLISNPDLINDLKDEMANMANRIDSIEARHGVTSARRGLEPTFGLMEAVYQWTEGMSFEQVTKLTDAHEGIIVRCIQRLDEVLKDIGNAGRIIGDNTLVQKMVDTSAAIRRDIVFAASLYTADESLHS